MACTSTAERRPSKLRQKEERHARARQIRDRLLLRPADEWVYTLVGGVAAPTLRHLECTAVLWSQGHLELLASVSNFKPPRIGTPHCSLLPLHRLDLWIGDMRVLALSWTENDALEILEFRHGEWEIDYFELPLFTGGWMPICH